MAITFTLDTNCIIDVDDKRAAMAAVVSLLEATRDGRVDVALVASSASEMQRDGSYLRNFSSFADRVAKLGFEQLPVLSPIAYFDISFWDVGVWADDAAMERESLIFTSLFPLVEPRWPDYARARGLDAAKDLQSPAAKEWRNCLCDTQAFWCHDHYERDIFVTSDGNFSRKLALAPAFAAARILTPSSAAAAI